MSGPEAVTAVPGVLAAERFFGRVEELRRLRLQVRSLVRGEGRSRVLCARPGAGKTELLRQLQGSLLREMEVFPFWYTLPREPWGEATLGGDFVASLALQALAFRRRDPALLSRPLTPAEVVSGLRASWPEAGLLLSEALADTGLRAGGTAALARAALAPQRLAALSGTRVLCLLDDAGNLANGADHHPWPQEAVASPIAPLLATIERESQLPWVFGAACAAGVTLERLEPLTLEAAARLARHLARTAGVELAEPAAVALARESAGSPFYLGALVRALADGPGSGPVDVARAAAASVCGGELARYWLEILSQAIPDRRSRSTALEILIHCLSDGGRDDAGRLATHMLKPESDVEAALAGLVRAGVVRVECASVVVEDDPVLHDVVKAHYQREFGRVPPNAVAAALVAQKVRNEPQVSRLLRREAMRDGLRNILGAWSGQRVPAALFDAGAGPRREDEARDRGAAAPDGSTREIVLPRVVSVASGRVGGAVSLPGLEVDALAWALRAGAGASGSEVAWVVRVLPQGGGAEHLEQFDRDITALQAAGELPAARVVRWAILETPLDPAGERAAERLRLSTSTLGQLAALSRLLGVPAALPPPDTAVAAVAAGPRFEIEMVIPRAVDVELVAARALEQLAENLSLDAAVTGRLKVALVEACINSFEHAGASDGRVRLVFSVDGDRLTTRVENRGRTLAALPPPAQAGREARGRGWGLTLIRELVDEVALEPREDGVSLRMVTHLGREGHA